MNRNHERTSTPRRLLGALLLSLALLACAASNAADIVVDTHRDDVPPLADGLCSLAEAIANAQFGGNPYPDCAAGSAGPDRILIEPGLPPIEVVSTMVLDTAVQIVGPANRQLIRPAAGFSRNLFQIDANSTTSGSFVFENLVLADGLATWSGPTSACSHSGSAICIEQRFINPQAFEVVIRNSIFDASANPVDCVGPLVTLRIEQSLFTNNSNAITSDRCNTVVRKSSLEFSSGAFGSAISVRLADLLIFDSLIDSSQGQDAVRLDAVNEPHLFVLANSMILDTDGGGLGLFGRVAGSIANSTIARNSGSAIVLDSNLHPGGTLDIVSSTIADNNATGTGTGGLVIHGAQTLIENSALIGNGTLGAAGQAASGIEIQGGSISIRNTILSNQVAGEGNLWRRDGAVINLRYSMLAPPDGAGDINGANQNNVFTSLPFGPLVDLGCRTTIGFPGNPTPNCVLLRPHGPFQTPIIDAAQANGDWDQRGTGFARIAGAGQDIGPYELQDPLVEFEPVALSLAEGTGGFTNFSFRVRRLGSTDATTLAEWELLGNGASPVNAADFDDSVLPFGTVFFDVGEREKTVDIGVFGDNIAEADEGFRVVLQGITGGQPGAVTEAFATILNDDALFSIPTLSISAVDADRPEGDLFVAAHRFRITRTVDTGGFCSYRLSIAGAGADPIEADDLGGAWALGTTGNYLMTPGEVSNDIDILIAGDSEAEGDEQFSVTLGNVSGCVVNPNAASAIGIVRNDDSSFAVQSIDTLKAEGDAGIAEFGFRIQRSAFVDKTASVSWSVLGSGAFPADAADFDGGTLPAGTVTMPPGVTSVPVTIRVRGDGQPEQDEDFRIQLGNPRSGGSIDPLADFAIGIIVNDDDPDGLFKDGFE